MKTEVLGQQGYKHGVWVLVSVVRNFFMICGKFQPNGSHNTQPRTIRFLKRLVQVQIPAFV